MIQQIRKSVSYLIGLTFISQLISFAREAIFAYYFGTSYQADAYVMASQIPTVLFAVFTTSINTVILPVYTSKKEVYGEKEADQFMNTFIMIFELVCFLLISIACVFAKPIVFIFAPSFSGNLLNLTIRYVRLLFPSILLSSIINILTVRFNANRKFAYPQYVGMFQNITIIVMMLVLARKINTDAVILGTILGLILNVIFLSIPNKDIFKEKIEVKTLWQDIVQVLSKVIPIALGVGIDEVNKIVDKAIASGLDTGSITGLSYANKLSVVFSALVVTALSTVCFQKFTELYAKEKYAERFGELYHYLQVLIYVLLPITCGVLIFKKEIITIAFARGAFGQESINLTVDIFSYYSIGILPIAAREIFSKYFLSSGDTKTPMLNSAVGVFINIIFNIIFSKFMGAPGLALATTMSYFVVCILLFSAIVKEQDNIEISSIVKDIFPPICASILMSAFVCFSIRVIWINSPVYKLLFGLVVGMSTYFFICACIAKERLKMVLFTLLRKV